MIKDNLFLQSKRDHIKKLLFYFFYTVSVSINLDNIHHVLKLRRKPRVFFLSYYLDITSDPFGFAQNNTFIMFLVTAKDKMWIAGTVTVIPTPRPSSLLTLPLRKNCIKICSESFELFTNRQTDAVLF